VPGIPYIHSFLSATIPDKWTTLQVAGGYWRKRHNSTAMNKNTISVKENKYLADLFTLQNRLGIISQTAAKHYLSITYQKN
jgi:hypothetical protein